MTTAKVDFKIRRGLSTELFGLDGLPKVKLEDGSWYLCTDTAKLYICVPEDNRLVLKLINENCSGNTGDAQFDGLVDLEVSSDGKLIAKYSNGSVKELVLPEAELSNYALKSDIPDVSGFITTIPDEYITETELENKGFLTEHQNISHLATKAELDDAITKIEHPKVDLTDYATKDYLTTVAVTNKYEVLPIEGMFVSYNGTEIRVNTQHVDIDSLPKQNAGDGSSDKLYYATFRAYAPEGATSVIEGQSDVMDKEHSELSVDAYGRKYTIIWPAIASKSGDTWTKYGDLSNKGDRVGKYLGFYYNFHWYAGDKLLSTDKVRVILTNDSCHNDLVPDAVARRIDDKVSAVNTTVVNITEQLQTIENTYVTTETLEQNYVTQNTVTELISTEVNTTVSETIETKVTEVVQEKIDAGEINVTADSISYGDF